MGLFHNDYDVKLAKIVAECGLSISDIPGLIAHIAMKDAYDNSEDKDPDILEATALTFIDMDMGTMRVKPEAKKWAKTLAYTYSEGQPFITRPEARIKAIEICETYSSEKNNRKEVFARLHKEVNMSKADATSFLQNHKDKMYKAQQAQKG